MDWQNLSKEECIKKLETNQNKGLSTSQVKKRLEQYGTNELTHKKKNGFFKKFIGQFSDFMVIILLIAAAVSFITSLIRHDMDFIDSIIILTIVVVNAFTGVIQESRAEKAIEALKKLSSPQATVLRDGKEMKIDSSGLVPGDIVVLSTGDMVPADLRILESYSLKAEESALTGESVPVEKSPNGIFSAATPIGDRTNMLFSGSSVTAGRGKGVVVATAMKTEVGKIAHMINTEETPQTPLQNHLAKTSKILGIGALIICGIIFILGLFQHISPLEMFMISISLAVAAIPEGLPVIVTIVLAMGVKRMATNRAIIRRLPAVETLGGASVICSDKTGTLTQNKMTVEDYYVDEKSIPAGAVDLTDSSQSRLMISSILCNDATNADGIEIGDPTETALLNLASGLGMDPEEVRKKYPRESENPFDSDRKLMATKHMLNGIPTMIVKGAVDVLLDRTDLIQLGDEVYEITREDRARIEAQNRKYSEEGLRVLAFAYKVVSDEMELTLQDEDHLIFLGLVAMMDPPREESAAAVAECKRAGIRPIMITGDHKVTAAAIAKRIGILKEESEACEGSQIDRMSDEELKDFVEGISVYARVSPEHKIRIVRAWQEKGNIVSMTGDGVNDAPALKQADVGVAMGITGSEVSKDAAAMILTDDNFATIVKAVENGRNLYRNIKFAIQFLLSGNFGAILAVLVASIFALPVPFAPVHLLFINLLTDSLPAIALGLEPHSKAVMEEKPRPLNESILTKDFLLRIAVEGVSVCATTMTAFLIGYRDGNALLASTMAFATLCSARLFHGFNCKSNKPVVFTKKVADNKYLIGAFALGILLVTAVVMIPGLHTIFKVQTLSFTQLFTVYGLAALNIPVIQLLKAIWVKAGK